MRLLEEEVGQQRERRRIEGEIDLLREVEGGREGVVGKLVGRIEEGLRESGMLVREMEEGKGKGKGREVRRDARERLCKLLRLRAD